ncbi:alpha/beta-hydrolase family protein [Phycicoccus sp.]|uniref:alpha/beta hydrolase n=1 Tax=Phycicoccus sp. TaxID=1902410 RepID=UPI002C14B61B|nr:alpha/beta-hydrolase family protein [Phycicoccus sp.]HMM95269.1 alpha/beta-hydrolase family protein [Phycicoccus sp.]
MTTLQTRGRPDDERRRRAPFVRRAAATGALVQRFEPPLGHPSHLTEARFSGPGLVLGGIFAAASLAPSLLPRPSVVQGVISGVSLAVGYGAGAALASLRDYLGIPHLRGRLHEAVVGAWVALCVGMLVLAGWKQVGWQNDIRLLYGMPPIGPDGWPLVAAVTVLVAAALLLLGRSLAAAFRSVRRRLGRRLPRRLATLLGGVLVVVAMWAAFSGVLVTGFFAGANALFAPSDQVVSAGTRAPTSPVRSGGPGSLVRWEDLGAEGRGFVSGGPTVSDIDAVTGGGARLPVRVYVGLRSADTAAARAQLVLRELQRTGAFDRKVLVLATTTGTGYLDRNGTDPLEYLWNGDTAIAGVQYSYLPSWISLLADQDSARQTSQAVFAAVHRYWSTLPEASRPRLYLYGLSLGAYGVESILGSMNLINEPIDGALLVGPPFVSPVHAQLTADRDPGSPATLPVFGNGRTVRFASESQSAQRTPGPWGPTRIVYLQHASDPVVFFSTDLAFTPPAWLREDQRGPDVSPRMGWFPVVTMVQVLLDLPGAGSVPMGYGHLYSAPANLQAWVGITEPTGWDAASLDRLAAVLAKRPHPYGNISSSSS